MSVFIHEANFVEAIELSTSDGFHWEPKRLTYQGHQLLNSIRDKEVWRLAKEAAKNGGTQTLELFGRLRKRFLRRKSKINPV